MEKLQQLLDAVLGDSTSKRPPQEPNDFSVERQRAFEESAKKIEALRRARLACVDPEH